MSQVSSPVHHPPARHKWLFVYWKWFFKVLFSYEGDMCQTQWKCEDQKTKTVAENGLAHLQANRWLVLLYNRALTLQRVICLSLYYQKYHFMELYTFRRVWAFERFQFKNGCTLGLLPSLSVPAVFYCVQIISITHFTASVADNHSRVECKMLIQWAPEWSEHNTEASVCVCVCVCDPAYTCKHGTQFKSMALRAPTIKSPWTINIRQLHKGWRCLDTHIPLRLIVRNEVAADV